MAPLEALYGWRCGSSIGWCDFVIVDSLDTNVPRDTMEQVFFIQIQLLTIQIRHNSYANRRVGPLEFMEGDRVWLRI